MNVSNRLRTQGWFWSIALIWVAAAYGREPLSVRVATTPGGPQIHVNGTPVPPRFFWGSENSGTSGPMLIGQYAVDLTPERDARQRHAPSVCRHTGRGLDQGVAIHRYGDRR